MEKLLLKQIFGGVPNKMVTTDANGNVVASQDLPSVNTLAVANLADPSPELSAITGTASTFYLVYQVDSNTNNYTIYSWEAADSSGANTPFVIADSGTGFWVAVAGAYTANGTTTRGEVVAGNGAVTLKPNGVLNIPIFSTDPTGTVSGDVWMVDTGTSTILRSNINGTIKGVELF